MGDCILCVIMYPVPIGCVHFMKVCAGTYVPQDKVLINDIPSKQAAAFADYTNANDTRGC